MKQPTSLERLNQQLAAQQQNANWLQDGWKTYGAHYDLPRYYDAPGPRVFDALIGQPSMVTTKKEVPVVAKPAKFVIPTEFEHFKHYDPYDGVGIYEQLKNYLSGYFDPATYTINLSCSGTLTQTSGANSYRFDVRTKHMDYVVGGSFNISSFNGCCGWFILFGLHITLHNSSPVLLMVLEHAFQKFFEYSTACVKQERGMAVFCGTDPSIPVSRFVEEYLKHPYTNGKPLLKAIQGMDVVIAERRRNNTHAGGQFLNTVFFTPFKDEDACYAAWNGH